MVGRRVLAHLYWNSDLVTDDEGVLYVKQWNHQIKAYAPDGALLFHPRRRTPDVFEGPEGEPIRTAVLRHLHFTANRLVAVTGAEIYVFERQHEPAALPDS
jgi:hypothetical protein